ncbi:hypothetical protein SASPL_118635 [Salvia splendens]|uniref:Uncharacterized protein n=1 Tax=Salvia splendens TaxID=180675 RepID=A0A8X8ZXF1_SALSN|nr:hypothetical protein SASPL_118635 [Salvia splendens]
MIIKPLTDMRLSIDLLEYSEEISDDVSMLTVFLAPSFPPPTAAAVASRRLRQSAGEDCKLMINNTVAMSMNIDDLLFSIIWS